MHFLSESETHWKKTFRYQILINFSILYFIRQCLLKTVVEEVLKGHFDENY